jgi:hypothetical protein
LLIAAFRGDAIMRERALCVLSCPTFEFWYSPLLRLELILQPTHQRRKIELAFYEEYFEHANCYGDLNRMFEIGSPDAMKHGISVVDALHVACANLSRCEVLLTTETVNKPMFKTKLVEVVSITDLRAASANSRVYRRMPVLLT